MKYVYIVFVGMLLFSCADDHADKKELQMVKEETSFFMTNDEIARLIQKQTTKINPESRKGYWEFQLFEKPLICITDENANRMRIISPIASLQEVKEEQLQAALAANFHSALDVRYAVSNGVLWAAFIHPLKELSVTEFNSAMLQVVSANKTFGTTYQSTQLFFNGAKPVEKEQPSLQKIQ